MSVESEAVEYRLISVETLWRFPFTLVNQVFETPSFTRSQF